MSVIDHTHAWPFPAISTDRRNGGSAWFKISEAHADQIRDAVPPVYHGALPGFFMGEASSHDANGRPIHCAVILRRGAYFAREIAVGGTSMIAAIDDLYATTVEVAS